MINATQLMRPPHSLTYSSTEKPSFGHGQEGLPHCGQDFPPGQFSGGVAFGSHVTVGAGAGGVGVGAGGVGVGVGAGGVGVGVGVGVGAGGVGAGVGAGAGGGGAGAEPPVTQTAVMAPGSSRCSSAQ